MGYYTIKKSKHIFRHTYPDGFSAFHMTNQNEIGMISWDERSEYECGALRNWDASMSIGRIKYFIIPADFIVVKMRKSLVCAIGKMVKLN